MKNPGHIEPHHTPPPHQTLSVRGYGYDQNKFQKLKLKIEKIIMYYTLVIKKYQIILVKNSE